MKAFAPSITHRSKSEKVALHPYQRAAVKFGLSRPAAGLWLAPGLGKTLIALTIFAILKKLGLVDELVVVAKRRIIHEVWPAEIKKWRFNFTSVIMHGRKKGDALRASADVRLINYEGLEWLARQTRFFKRDKRLMLVLDESSKIRHTNTIRYKSLKKILQFFDRRYLLTGSPAPNGLINLFGQIYALDYGESLGAATLTEFRNRYFYPSGYMGYRYSLQRGAKKEIHRAIKPLVVRFGTDQLDMPPLTFVDKWVRLPLGAREEYDELEREHLLQYEDGEIVAANAAVATNKLRQLANGGAYYSRDGVVLDEFGKKLPLKWRVIHHQKCAELVELLEELQGEPALCTFEFQHDKYRIQQYFKKHAKQFVGAPFIDGKSKDRDVAKILARWDRGEIPVLFGHPDSVAHGLNLQGKGGIVIFFAMTWNLENYEQFIQRVWRQGQKRRVMVYRILVRNTVDEDMIAAIAQKDHDQTSLLEAMGRRLRRRRRYKEAA